MANEKRNCNQICRWNDPSDGCIKPTYATCPMANTEPDASGWGQVNEKRLIDANALIAQFDDSFKGFVMARIIDEQPTVDAVEVVHGHWVSLTDCSNAGVYCSVCHKKVYKEDYDRCNRKNKMRSNYCPNCGAKMDGGNGDG